MTFSQCAQECAHPIVANRMHRIVERIADHGLSVKAAVFQTGIIETSRCRRKFARSASTCAFHAS
jgi:hypothetical protein